MNKIKRPIGKMRASLTENEGWDMLPDFIKDAWSDPNRFDNPLWQKDFELEEAVDLGGFTSSLFDPQVFLQDNSSRNKRPVMYTSDKGLLEKVALLRRGRTSFLSRYLENSTNPSYGAYKEWCVSYRTGPCASAVFDVYNEQITGNKAHTRFKTLDTAMTLMLLEHREVRAYPKKQRYLKEDKTIDKTKIDTRLDTAALKTALSKFREMEKTIADVIKHRTLLTHALIVGAPGVGKSHVGAAAAAKAAKSVNRVLVGGEGEGGGTAPETFYDLIAFLWINRQAEKVVLMDDSDNMLTSKDKRFNNVLKWAFNPSDPVINLSGLGDRARKYATAQVGKAHQKYDEHTPHINASKSLLECVELSEHEGGSTVEKLVCKILKDHQVMFRAKLSLNEEDIPEIPKKGRGRPTGSKESDLQKLLKAKAKGKEKETDEQQVLAAAIATGEIDEEEAKKLGYDPSKSETETAPEGFLIPEVFQFNSTLIFLSNLELAEVNEAIVGRFAIEEMYFTQDEIMAYIESILAYVLGKPNVPRGIPMAVRPWGKETTLRLFNIALEMASSGKSLTLPSGEVIPPPKINREISVRFFEEMTTKLIGNAYNTLDELNDLSLGPNLSSISDLFYEQSNGLPSSGDLAFDQKIMEATNDLRMTWLQNVLIPKLGMQVKKKVKT